MTQTEIIPETLASVTDNPVACPSASKWVMSPATVANNAVRVKKITAFTLSRSRKDWRAFIKTMPRLLSIANA